MKCDEIIYEIVPFCCGDLDEQKEKEFKRHTTVCKKCAQTFFRIKKTLQYLHKAHDSITQMQSVDLTDDIQI
ncbi:MAG: hypothetical protein LBD46_01360 [Endomicrobium sp.]|jgi:hypothetical protein|nr:hypothetical protein [Endomicrobium sp.]